MISSTDSEVKMTDKCLRIMWSRGDRVYPVLGLVFVVVDIHVLDHFISISCGSVFPINVYYYVSRFKVDNQSLHPEISEWWDTGISLRAFLYTVDSHLLDTSVDKMDTKNNYWSLLFFSPFIWLSIRWTPI